MGSCVHRRPAAARTSSTGPGFTASYRRSENAIGSCLMEPNPLLPSIPVLIAVVVGVVILVAVIVIVIGARRTKRRNSVLRSHQSHNPGSGHPDEG